MFESLLPPFVPRFSMAYRSPRRCGSWSTILSLVVLLANLAPCLLAAPPRQESSQTAPQRQESTNEVRPRPQPDNRRRDFNGILRLHDPSRIVKEGDTYWIVHTGNGIGSIYSTDLKDWKRGPDLLSKMPDWVQEVVPQHRGYYWAPDIIHLNDRFLVYYSVSSFGKNESAIGMISSPTMNPESENYQWTDHGIVVRTRSESDHNAIDPAIIQTSTGQLWMSFGSFWSGLKMVELDPKTGLVLNADQAPVAIAYQEQIEAPEIYEHDGYYYLFMNWGWCCRGVRSTYNIRVGRSRSVTGPFLDRNGVDLRTRGGTLVLESQGSQIGPGHPGIFKTEDGWLMGYHYYDENNRGRSRLGLRPLTWDSEGWPQLGDEMLDRQKQ